MFTTYEKPSMQFVSLRNEETVADTCWGHHGTNTRMYCDVSGEGFLSFRIADGSCTLNIIDVLYHKGHDDKEGTSLTSAIDPDGKMYAELEAILRKAGGESGNPYKGDDIEVGKPEEKWS